MEEKMPKRQKLDSIADSTSGEQGTSSTSSSSTSSALNVETETEEKSEGTEVEEERPEVKFNVRDRSHQNRCYRRTLTLDSDDEEEDTWSPPEPQGNPEEVVNNEAEPIEETNNNEEHEIMSGVIEFGDEYSDSSSSYTSSMSFHSSDLQPSAFHRDEEDDGPAEEMDGFEEAEDPDVDFILSDDNTDSMSDSDQDVDLEDFQNFKAETELVDKLIEYPKLDYVWNLKELMFRENGFTSREPQSSSKIHSSFESRFYSSRHIVEKLRVEKKRLSKHKGCVNCLNFNKNGNILVSGSDDLRIILWDWPSRKIIHNFKSGHTSNIFQTKFVELNNSSASIVSSARDGCVLFSQIPPSGLTEIQPKKVYSHSSAVHKIALNPSTPSEIMSAGEDGWVVSCDIRTNEPTEVISVDKSNSRKVRLYSISHHPHEPQICIGGTSQYVYVYDKRNYKTALSTMSPSTVVSCESHKQVTCALYNCKGDEILASYSYDNAYLFDNKGAYTPGTYKHSYIGHLNRKTIKGINFFGPNSEYIIGGSDCGNVFFWDKENESIVNVFKGDTHIVRIYIL
ncbi:DCAF8 family protein [Megaselia abdita]